MARTDLSCLHSAVGYGILREMGFWRPLGPLVGLLLWFGLPAAFVLAAIASVPIPGLRTVLAGVCGALSLAAVCGALVGYLGGFAFLMLFDPIRHQQGFARTAALVALFGCASPVRGHCGAGNRISH